MHPTDTEGKMIHWLLDITWGAKVYHFSTTPVRKTDGTYYAGGMSDISITQTASYASTSIDDNSIPMELTFTDIDWIKEWLQGRTLANAQAKIYLAAVQDDTVTTSEHVFTGYVVDPIFAVPTKPPGYVTFSIEQRVVRKKILEDGWIIDAYRFPGLDQRAAALGRFIQYPMGKYVPLAFGTLGVWTTAVSVGTDNALLYSDRASCTPVYAVDVTGSGVTLEVKYVLCIGKTGATRVRIFDQTGGNFVNTIRRDQNADGVIYSYTTYKLGSVIEDNAFFPAIDEDQTFWASWGEYGDAMIDPLTKESLSLAGNLCMYILSIMGIDYNLSAWLGLKTTLNRYKFAGYINDGGAYTFEWWMENIVQYLPITVIQGEQGLEPKLNLYYYNRDQIYAKYHISESGIFQQLTPLQPLDIDIVNKVTLRYAYEGDNDHYLSTFVIDPTMRYTDKLNPMRQRDPISDISYQQYGLKEAELELPFVWDYDTAQRIAKDYIRLRALGGYGIEIQADSRYTYLQVGDVIAYTNSALGISGHKCMIVSKSWANNSWHFIIQLESNTLINPRSI